MSASDLSGRDLDVAVARAMGWTQACETPGLRADYRNWLEPSGGSVHRLRRYGTDPATLDEKLVWLSNRIAFAIRYLPDSGRVHVLWWPNGGRDDVISGKDIHEATARLVVAVKEAMGDG